MAARPAPMEFVSGELRIIAHGSTRIQAGDQVASWINDVYTVGTKITVTCPKNDPLPFMLRTMEEPIDTEHADAHCRGTPSASSY